MTTDFEELACCDRFVFCVNVAAVVVLAVRAKRLFGLINW